MKQLRDFCEGFIVPQRDKPKEFGGNIPWCRIEDIDGKYLAGTKSGQYVTEETIKKMNLRLIPEGAVICSCSASLGVQAILKVPCITNQTFIGIVPGQNLSKEYLYYFLKSKTEYFRKIGTGTTIPYISRKKFEELLIPEVSLEQQRAVVDVLERLERVINHRKQEIQNLDDLIKARFVELFGQGGYPSVTLKDITDVITKGTTPTTAGYSFLEEGVNFFKIESIMEDHTINLDKVAHVSEECHKAFKRSQLKEGDILFSIAGAIGRTAIITKNDLPGNTNQALAIIRLSKDSMISGRYLIEALGSPLVTEQYNKKKRGVAQINLSLQDIGNLTIPMPNQATQEEFELFAKQVDKSKVN